MTVRRTIRRSAPGRYESRGTRYTFEELFFKFGLGNFYFNSLVHLLCVTTSMVRVILDSCREQGIDESCFAQSRFARNLEQFSFST